MELGHLFYSVNLFTLFWESVCLDVSMLESVPFLLEFVCLCVWCYTAYKSGKYFIYPEGKIFRVHIRQVKIRRTKPLKWLTTKQSGSYKVLIINMPRRLPWT